MKKCLPLFLILIALVSGSSEAALTADQMGLVINDNSPSSVEIGAYYQLKRKIPEQNVVHVRIGTKQSMTVDDALSLKAQIDAKLGKNVQAMALAWTYPVKVDCNALTAVLTRGYMPQACGGTDWMSTCGFATPSPYYNTNSRQPFTDYKMRISMMLAGPTTDDVKNMIDRGVASDGTNPRGAGYIMQTSDSLRSLRAEDGWRGLSNTAAKLVDTRVLSADTISNKTNTMFYFQGLYTVPDVAKNTFLPGAVMDSLTSFWGFSAMKYAAANGLTASFGTITEPCAIAEKFSNPAILVNNYTAGDTVIEAYWKSVSQTFQGNFIGEPLAHPYSGNQVAAPKVANVYITQLGLQSYIGQDSRNGVVTVDNAKGTLSMSGNRWQVGSLAYTVTPKTVLEFDMKTIGSVAEIVGIAMLPQAKVSDNVMRKQLFSLESSQRFGVETFNQNAPDVSVARMRHIRIEIGKAYTGLMNSLVFIRDADHKPSDIGTVVFSNIKITETE